MTRVKRELQTRAEEVNNYLTFITAYEKSQISINMNEEAPRIDSTMFSTSAKASLIIMLYNMVESIITTSLDTLHETLNRKRLKYDDLNDRLKKLLIVYYNYSINGKNDIHKAADLVMDLIKHIQGGIDFDITYEELSKNYTLYSGNLDSKEISSVLFKYGITFEEKVSELQSIKKKRNYLAHGEKSFEEVGRELTHQCLTVYCDRTICFLEKVIDTIEVYLNDESYKAD